MTHALSQVLPYGLGAATLLVVVLFLAKAYFSELMKTAAARTPGAAHRLAAWLAPTGGRRLRRYRRAVLHTYSRHRLGFSEGTEGRPVDISEVFVPLQYLADGRRADVTAQLAAHRRTVLLGEPGAGKSLLLKHAMVRWAAQHDDRTVPVMVDLHQCNTSTAGLRDLVIAEFDRAGLRNAADLVDRALQEGRLQVHFDGLDEVGSEAHDRVVDALRDFAVRHGECRIVVTCRNSAYREQLDEHFDQVLRLADFDDAAILEFLDKWPGIVAPGRIYQDLQADPELLGLARSPLMLTMIAYLQSGDRAESVGPLPTSRSAFFDVAVTHLLDRDRRLGRAKSLWLYTAQRKMLVLERIARDQLEATAPGGDRQEISRRRLETIVAALLPGFDLGPEHTEPLIDEIAHRSQLLKPLDRIHRHYSFTHLSLLEYLAARALADEPRRLLDHYRDDPDVWRETVRMWCAIARTDCTPVLREVFAATEPAQRLLALQCLAEATHVDGALAEDILRFAFDRLGARAHDRQAAAKGLGILASAHTPRGARVRERLVQALGGDPATRAGALAALTASGRPESAAALAARARHRDDTDARDALQAMGDTAVPALTEAARGGARWAVRSLGAVGTPAAAEALVELLWQEDDPGQARTAAWALAALLRSPAVADRLRRTTLTPAQAAAPAHDLVWTPFRATEPHGSALPRLAGRIAWLLDAGGADGDALDPTDLEASAGITVIDPRIGIPLAAIGAARARVEDPGQERRDEGPVVLAAAARLGIPLRPAEPAALFAVDPPTPAAAAGIAELMDTLLIGRGVDPLRRRIFELLPWAVRCRMILHCMGPYGDSDRVPAWDTWRAVRDNPPAPRLWTGLATAAGVCSGIALVLLGGLRAAGTVFGWHPLGLTPLGLGWAGWATLIGLVCVPVLLVVAAARNSEDLFTVLALLLVCVCPALLFAALWGAAQLVGGPVTFGAAALLVLAVWLPARIAAARNRARANPLRPALEAAEAAG